MNWQLQGADIHTLWTSIVLLGLGYLVGTFIFSRVWISLVRKGNTSFIGRSGKKENMARFGTSFVATAMGKQFAAIQYITDLTKPMIGYWAIVYPLVTFAPFFDTSIVGIFFLGNILGHIFPVWWKFKGGLGVATGVGYLFMINWFIAFMGLFSYIIAIAFLKNSSYAGIIGAWVGIVLLFVPGIANFEPFMVMPVVQSGVGGLGQFIYPSIIVLGVMTFKFRKPIIGMYNKIRG